MDISIILYLGAIGAFINVFLQTYDILWCRWHHCGKSYKNSVEPKPTYPSDDFPTQSVVSIHTEFLKELNNES